MALFASWGGGQPINLGVAAILSVELSKLGAGSHVSQADTFQKARKTAVTRKIRTEKIQIFEKIAVRSAPRLLKQREKKHQLF